MSDEKTETIGYLAHEVSEAPPDSALTVAGSLAGWNLRAPVEPTISLSPGTIMEIGDYRAVNASNKDVTLTATDMKAYVDTLQQGFVWTTTKVPLELARKAYDALKELTLRTESGLGCRACATEICPDCYSLDKALDAARKALEETGSIINGPIPMSGGSTGMASASYSGNMTIPTGTISVSGTGTQTRSGNIATFDEHSGQMNVW